RGIFLFKREATKKRRFLTILVVVVVVQSSKKCGLSPPTLTFCHCEEHRDEAIHGWPRSQHSLAMTCGILRLFASSRLKCLKDHLPLFGRVTLMTPSPCGRGLG